MEQAVAVEESRTTGTTGLIPAAPTSPPRQAAPASESAKQYARIKLVLAVFTSLFFFLVTIVLVATGLTTAIEEFARGIAGNDYLVLLLFVGALWLLEGIVTLPLSYYSGYVLEHRYGLSNQTRGVWVREGIKGVLVGAALMMPLVLVVFFWIRTYGALWWLPVGATLFLFSVILARLAPILIFPLFYKFKPLEEGGLKTTILALCGKIGMPVEGVFVFDMSRNTKKANAAFTGIGKSRRIILGDTLVANFTDEEIETVFAHELGHYKLRHVWVMMAFGTVSSFLGLYGTALVYDTSLGWFGFTTPDEIAALPLLGLWLGVYSLLTNPLSNMLSRAHEYAADRFAVQLSGKTRAFQNALTKLAKVNLADPSPHPLVEFLFHSHPSIEKRIRSVEGRP
ncbi:MAG: M48 family metallopeptidase [Bacteroidota bacterium]